MTPRITMRCPAKQGPGVRTLLLYGLAGSSVSWNGFAQRAACDLEVWDVELPWRGGSDQSWAYSGEARSAVDAALRALPQRSTDSPAADLVVAHSFGASALLDLVTTKGASQIGAMVLVAPLTCAEPFDWDEIGERVDDFPRLLEEGICHRPSRKVSPEVARDLALRMRQLIGPMPWLRMVEHSLRSATLELEGLCIPTLVVAGERDTVSSAVRVEKIAARIPDAKFTALADCGHFPMVDDADEFASVVNTFALRSDRKKG